MITLKGLHRPVGKQYPISSPYGVMRKLTIDGQAVEREHKGIDFKCPNQTPVEAMMGGQIWEVGYEDEENPKKGYGYRIIQRGEMDGKIYWLYYGHLNSSMVHRGLFVVKGEYIATSGNSGASTGPHLHVSARGNNQGDYLNMEFENVG